MKEITINSVSKYVAVVCEENEKMKKTGMKGDTLLFRGQADMGNDLIPSIGRTTGTGKALIDEERNMIEMAKYKLPTVFMKNLEPIELLALLQHHGIPTRLLDISENALVGLYFACHDDKNTPGKDGEVIVFKNNDLSVANYPLVNTICESYKADAQIETDREFLFVYAPSYSLRQNIQRGRYILFTDSYEGDRRLIKPIAKDHESIALRIIVPSDAKKQIRRDLRLLGVSKELLFLDNADMVCKEITDRFSER